jgi:hypothetical protein
MAAFWDVAPCSLVEVYRRFSSAYCLHNQGDDGLNMIQSRFGLGDAEGKNEFSLSAIEPWPSNTRPVHERISRHSLGILERCVRGFLIGNPPLDLRG